MDISTAPHGHAIVIAVAGRLDGATAPAFEARLLDLIAEGHRRLVVDLAGLGYISSAGLRALLVAAKSVNSQGGRILLAAPCDPVAQVLGISGFCGMLETCATTEEALARAKT